MGGIWELNKSLRQKISQGMEARMTFLAEDFDGSRREYVRLFVPYQRLILLGGGHIACELCRFASQLDFDVVVADDRQEFANEQRFPDAVRTISGNYEEIIEKLQITAYDYVAVMTRGHSCDSLCLRRILEGTMPRYLGMVGSRRKVALVMEMLEKEGYDRECLQQVEAPIGLMIGGRTPAEIAVSILAQLIQYRNTGISREENLLDYCNSDKRLLEYMETAREAYVLVVVLEKSGSAPVSGGAIMAVDQNGIAAGTVGGGRGEFDAAETARQVLQDGISRMLRVNMTNADAAGQGMICGGTLKLWLQYCAPENEMV